MSGARRPSWGHDAYEMALMLRKQQVKCRDGCGAWIMFVKTPNGVTMPVEKVGEEPNPDSPGQVLHIVEIHHDNCVNPRVDGARDPARSHRIAKNEDVPVLAEEQRQFTLHKMEV